LVDRIYNPNVDISKDSDDLYASDRTFFLFWSMT